MLWYNHLKTTPSKQTLVRKQLNKENKMAQDWTPERRAEFGARMKAKRLERAEAVKKQAGVPEVGDKINSTPPTVVWAVEDVNKEQLDIETAIHQRNVDAEASTLADAPATTIAGSITDPNNTTEQLLLRALEAIANLTAQNNNGGANLQNGKLTGTVEKYSLNKEDYPDPTERLANEPGLARFGFKENYELKWAVNQSPYTTIDNVRMIEPKFIVDLIRVMYNDETGEKTNGRYNEYRIILHEDPDSALWVARENGIDVDSMDEKTFLNEMRYLQIRDWLLECFYPKKPQAQSNAKQMVINGKLVEYFEVNDETPQKIFEKL
jgi:hypothetical protein